MQVVGDNLTMQIVANDKEGWPDPPATVIGLVSDTTSTTLRAIQGFFAVTKGIEVGDGTDPPESAPPDADPIADDPDGL
jgi:hypothetical protein